MFVTNSEIVDGPRAGRREWLGLAVIALPCLLYSMDFTVLHLAVPHLSAALEPSSTQLLWIVDIYGFLLSGALLTMGVLGDRIGRRKLLLAGAVVFGAASVLAAFADSPGTLIAARALLGLAGATLAPSTLSLIRTMFLDAAQRTVAIGVWVASFAAGGAIGPLVGGLLLDHFWWGSVFLVAVPPMVLLLVLGPLVLPEYRNPDAGRIDIPSAALSLVGVLAVIYGIKQYAQGSGSWTAPAAVVLGVAAGSVFVRRQRHLADPFIDLELFRARAFSTMLALNTMAFFLGFASFFFMTQYLQLVLGLDPLEAGLWTLPWAAAQVGGSLLTPVLVRRMRPGTVVAVGLLVAAAGFAVITPIGGRDDLWLVVAGSVLFSLGLIQVITLAADLMVGSVPPERAGVASGLNETSADFGGALGIAVLGSVATAVYRTRVGDTSPAGIPAPVSEVARDTLGGALEAARELPAAAASALEAASRAAFTDAASLVFWLCWLLALAAAVCALWGLRGDGTAAAAGPEAVEPEAASGLAAQGARS